MSEFDLDLEVANAVKALRADADRLVKKRQELEIEWATYDCSLDRALWLWGLHTGLVLGRLGSLTALAVGVGVGMVLLLLMQAGWL